MRIVKHGQCERIRKSNDKLAEIFFVIRGELVRNGDAFERDTVDKRDQVLFGGLKHTREILDADNLYFGQSFTNSLKYLHSTNYQE